MAEYTEGVGALIYARSTNRYLFLLRSRSRHAGSWGIAGGKIEAGETVIHGLVREIREEMDNVMEEMYTTGENTSPLRRRIENLRESIGVRLQNVEIGGAHQVGEEIGYEEDCQDNGM